MSAIPKPLTDRNELARLVAEAAANVPASPEARAKLAQHGMTPEQMRAMIRPLALWMIETGAEGLTLTRAPGSAHVNLTIHVGKA